LRYITIARQAQAEHTQSRSRFIASVRPVTTEDEALVFIDSTRRAYWDAKHNVYAYIVREGGAARFSDDGEPPSTAGQPVMEVLRHAGLCDVCMVVTRYFGGVLLGTGGLVRAYSAAARMAVEAAGTTVMRLCAVLELRYAYAYHGKICAAAQTLGAAVLDTSFAEDVTLKCAVETQRRKAFEERAADICGGEVSITLRDTRYIAAGRDG